MLMNILERYLGKIILRYTMLAQLALLGLFTFVNFLDQVGDLGGGYGLLEAMAYVTLLIPRTVYELFPMAALLGAIIGLSLLAGDSELTAARTNGVSILQIAAAALKTGALIALVAMLIGELLAPVAEARAHRIRADALAPSAEQNALAGEALWLRDGDAFVRIGAVLADGTLLAIKWFEFDADKKLRALGAAASGNFVAGRWVIYDVKQTRFGRDGGVDTAHFDSGPWRTTITPQTLGTAALLPQQLSLRQLYRHLARLTRQGLSTEQQTAPYWLAFWGRLMLPLSAAVMVILAIPFVFANLRRGALGRSLFIGIMLGLGFHIANNGFGFIVLAYGLPPLLGAAAPTVAFLALALGMMRAVR